MKSRKSRIMTLLAVLLLIAAISLSSWGATSSTVDIKNKEGIGNYLVDSTGMTLYTFKKDSPGKSACMGECTAMWRVFYAEIKSVPSALKRSDFGSITRGDGIQQTTYKGMPLYYFVDDKQPGDTFGNGVFNLWLPARTDGSW